MRVMIRVRARLGLSSSRLEEASATMRRMGPREVPSNRRWCMVRTTVLHGPAPTSPTRRSGAWARVRVRVRVRARTRSQG